MYLTDYRERSLKDVITQLEPGLFKKVTGLTVNDFELLVSLGVFNSALMNDAVYKFKRYEDASLSYTGIDKHQAKLSAFTTPYYPGRKLKKYSRMNRLQSRNSDVTFGSDFMGSFTDQKIHRKCQIHW